MKKEKDGEKCFTYYCSFFFCIDLRRSPSKCIFVSVFVYFLRRPLYPWTVRWTVSPRFRSTSISGVVPRPIHRLRGGLVVRENLMVSLSFFFFIFFFEFFSLIKSLSLFGSPSPKNNTWLLSKSPTLLNFFREKTTDKKEAATSEKRTRWEKRRTKSATAL